MQSRTLMVFCIYCPGRWCFTFKLQIGRVNHTPIFNKVPLISSDFEEMSQGIKTLMSRSSYTEDKNV